MILYTLHIVANKLQLAYGYGNKTAYDWSHLKTSERFLFAAHISNVYYKHSHHPTSLSCIWLTSWRSSSKVIRKYQSATGAYNLSKCQKWQSLMTLLSLPGLAPNSSTTLTCGIEIWRKRDNHQSVYNWGAECLSRWGPSSILVSSLMKSVGWALKSGLTAAGRLFFAITWVFVRKGELSYNIYTNAYLQQRVGGTFLPASTVPGSKWWRWGTCLTLYMTIEKVSLQAIFSC